MAAGWTTIAVLDGAGNSKTIRVWQTADGYLEFGHALDPDNLADYETVAASQTGQALGATGAAGDFLAGLLVVPATTSPGNVEVGDGVTSPATFTAFEGGSSSVSNLVPFFVPLGAKSTAGAWKVTTGANVSVVAFGKFT